MTIFKAHPTARPVPDLQIVATEPIPTDGLPLPQVAKLYASQGNQIGLPLPQVAKLYASQGNQIADALFESLPGGTVDQVIAALLVRRASLLRVVHDQS